MQHSKQALFVVERPPAASSRNNPPLPAPRPLFLARTLRHSQRKYHCAPEGSRDGGILRWHTGALHVHHEQDTHTPFQLYGELKRLHVIHNVASQMSEPLVLSVRSTVRVPSKLSSCTLDGRLAIAIAVDSAGDSVDGGDSYLRKFSKGVQAHHHNHFRI